MSRIAPAETGDVDFLNRLLDDEEAKTGYSRRWLITVIQKRFGMTQVGAIGNNTLYCVPDGGHVAVYDDERPAFSSSLRRWESIERAGEDWPQRLLSGLDGPEGASEKIAAAIEGAMGIDDELDALLKQMRALLVRLDVIAEGAQNNHQWEQEVIDGA